MDYQACPNLARLFFDQAKRLGSKPFLWAKRDGAWEPLTWQQAEAQVLALARGLQALGVGRGDRVAVVAENRPEWVVADLAIVSLGALVVPAYITNTVNDHRHILANSGAKGAIVSTRALTERVLPAAREVPGCSFVAAIDPPAISQTVGPRLLSWTELLALGQESQADIAAIVDTLQRTDTACIIHTSGTGGLPKGVALAHGAILHNCRAAYDLLKSLGVEDETFLSFLPLSHSYEHTCGLYFPISIGAQVYFAEGADALASNLVEVNPTIMTAVPRLYETLHARIARAMSRAGGRKAKLFERAVELGKRRYEDPRSLSLWERILNLILDRLVRAKVQARFGTRLKAMVSGGGPLSYEIGLFFTALNVRILQGYGQTETAPVVACNPPQRPRLDTVGPPLTATEVKIAEDGEILVKGELVMQGYWNDPEATAKAIQDGWLHTGDIGEIGPDGYLKITDRKRDILKNSGGDMVSPARVEGFLTLQPEIVQAMVYGDNRPHLVALLVPAPELVDSFAKANGVPADLTKLAKEPGFRKLVEPVIARVNKQLSQIERIRRFVIAPEPFSVANEMLTPTLKIRRHKIKAVYGPTLDALYEGGS